MDIFEEAFVHWTAGHLEGYPYEQGSIVVKDASVVKTWQDRHKMALSKGDFLFS